MITIEQTRDGTYEVDIGGVRGTSNEISEAFRAAEKVAASLADIKLTPWHGPCPACHRPTTVSISWNPLRRQCSNDDCEYSELIIR